MKHATFLPDDPANPFPRSNGKLIFKTNWRWAWIGFTVHGGPFPNFVEGDNTFGVNLRAEQKHKCDAYLPIRDFSVPTQTPEVVASTIEMTIMQAMRGKDVYMGCMGGWGRTGTALALIAKIMQDEDPVLYVREHYTPRAVETDDQQDYVAQFDVTALRSRLQSFAWRLRVKRLFGGTA